MSCRSTKKVICWPKQFSSNLWTRPSPTKKSTSWHSKPWRRWRCFTARFLKCISFKIFPTTPSPKRSASPKGRSCPVFTRPGSSYRTPGAASTSRRASAKRQPPSNHWLGVPPSRSLRALSPKRLQYVLARREGGTPHDISGDAPAYFLLFRRTIPPKRLSFRHEADSPREAAAGSNCFFGLQHGGICGPCFLYLPWGKLRLRGGVLFIRHVRGSRIITAAFFNAIFSRALYL